MLDISRCRYLVVGAGFFGSTVAERIASVLGERVVVIDKHDHIGGHSYSEKDSETGVECHKYGSHIFHTKHEEVWEYITQFTRFNSYRHQVFTKYLGKTYTMPVNLHTINNFYGTDLTPGEVENFLQKDIEREGITEPKNLEEKAICLIGRPLYEAFVRGYTIKQWNMDPKDLPAYIITRLPFRRTLKTDYFDDPHQGIPVDGYGAVFRRILDNPRIELHLNTDFFDLRDQLPPECTVIFTGPMDRFFDYKHGRLGWRTLKFEVERHNMEYYQGNSVINYAEAEVPYTRIHEFKHYHPEREHRNDATIIFKEFSKDVTSEDEELYYPVTTRQNDALYATYKEEAAEQKNVLFGGRLGGYKYYDMDTTILAALNFFEENIRPRHMTKS